MEEVVTHYGKTILQHSVEWYKEKLSVYSKDVLQNLLIPQLYEWSNAYKAAVELTENIKTKGKQNMDSIYLIYNKYTGEIKERVFTLKEAFDIAQGEFKVWEVC